MSNDPAFILKYITHRNAAMDEIVSPLYLKKKNPHVKVPTTNVTVVVDNAFNEVIKVECNPKGGVLTQ